MILSAWRARADRRTRFVTFDSLRWIVRHRAWTPWYLIRYWRFLRFRATHPHVITEGMVFLGKRVEVEVRPGFGRLVLGRWVHIGDGTSIRCHEGTMRVGDKTVFGRNIVINGYLDIIIGSACIVADMVYVTDFDHVFADVHTPIKDQGIVKAPVRIGSDVWLGTKATVVRGVSVGDGSVVAAHAVVTRDLPPFAVAAGVPARVLRDRRDDAAGQAETQAALADMAAKLRSVNAMDSLGTPLPPAGPPRSS